MQIYGGVIMPINQSLISLAIIKVNSREGVDCYSTFLPHIQECIRLFGSKIITSTIIGEKLKNSFGINIPTHVIETILSRMVKDNLVSINKDDKTILPTDKLLNDKSFNEQRNEIQRTHNLLIDEIIDYCKTKFKIDWTRQQAEEALLSFIDEFQISLAQNRNNQPVPFTVKDSEINKLVIGDYITSLSNENSSYLNYIGQITRGYMMANQMFLQDPSQANRRFKKTKIFFDSTFLIYALGYAGQAYQKPCTELF
jgi:hypothetical protein